jgi:hypothetical protein
MATAQDFIEAALVRSSANDPGKLATDGELLNHCSRLVARLFSLFARARPDKAQSTTALVLAGNPASLALPQDLIDLRRVEKADGTKVHLIPATEKERTWHIAPSVYQVGNTLYSRAKAGDPVATDVLTLYVLDQPVALATLASVIDARFPVRHHQLVIDLLALYLDTKDVGRDASAHEKLKVELAEAKQAFALEYNLGPSALEWIHEGAGRTPTVASS